MPQKKVMPRIRVKEKFQVTIPTSIRKEAGLVVGDYLEAAVEGRKIVLQPKTKSARDSIEAAIEEGLRAYEEGRVTPAFASMKEFEEYRRAKKK